LKKFSEFFSKIKMSEKNFLFLSRKDLPPFGQEVFEEKRFSRFFTKQKNQKKTATYGQN